MSNDYKEKILDLAQSIDFDSDRILFINTYEELKNIVQGDVIIIDSKDTDLILECSKKSKYILCDKSINEINIFLRELVKKEEEHYIKRISCKMFNYIIDKMSNEEFTGLFYCYDRKVNKWIAMDNSSNNAWVEEFDSLEETINYLESKPIITDEKKIQLYDKLINLFFEERDLNEAITQLHLNFDLSLNEISEISGLYVAQILDIIEESRNNLREENEDISLGGD